MLLRVDPWDPQYGSSVEFDGELAAVAGLDLTVEAPGTWSPMTVRLRSRVPCCAFIDGVRRIDARLFADEGEVQVPGLAGSWAVGCAWSTRPPSIGTVETGREIVVGGGLLPPVLLARVGTQLLRFSPSAVPGSDFLDPLRGLQNAMREAEAETGTRRQSGGGKAELVVADGPLSYAMAGRLVGMVKRQISRVSGRRALEGDRNAAAG